MKNITNMTNKLWTWVKLSVFTFPLFVFVSCSQEECLPQETTKLQFVVSDFPAFGESGQTRTIGTEDTGKSAWVIGDEILVLFDTEYYGKQVATLTYGEDEYGNVGWNINQSEPFHTLSSTSTYTIEAWYAPCYTLNAEGSLVLKSDKMAGTDEIIQATTINIDQPNYTINISFADATRNYSRLRIAGLTNLTYTVTTTGFTPAGATTAATEAYTLTADGKGNAYLYGTFAKDATVTVKQGDAVQAEYTFSAENGFPNGTAAGWSYALNTGAVINGTSTDIDALVEKLKEYIDSGTTTITVTGSELAAGEYYKTAIGEAIYRLSVDDTDEYDETNSYNGTIDLILPDVTEIADYDFEYAYALKSITLPKVTTLGDLAFNDCRHLQKITFESLVTEGYLGSETFQNVGTAVDGCDLVLNCKQTDDSYVSYNPIADMATKTWCETTWKSITLIHSGDNKYCNVCLGY